MTELTCVRHPRRETRLRCSKCENPICTSCAITTPVGMRCRNCAQLRRLPQYQFDPLLVARSGAAGLAVSVLLWSVVESVPYLAFFLAIVVGFGVGEVMSRLSRRRDNLVLEVLAVAVTVAGFATALWVRGLGDAVVASVQAGAPPLGLLLPPVLASVVAVIKLR